MSKRDLLLAKLEGKDHKDLIHSNEVNEQYEAKLLQDIQTKIQFLKNFKSHEISSSTNNIQTQLSHLMTAMGKLSYFPERRDTIGISLALSNLDKHITELKQYLENLENKQKIKSKEYQELVDINSQYKNILEQRNNYTSIKDESNITQDDLLKQISIEKKRQFQLKEDYLFIKNYVQKF